MMMSRGRDMLTLIMNVLEVIVEREKTECNVELDPVSLCSRRQCSRRGNEQGEMREPIFRLLV